MLTITYLLIGFAALVFIAWLLEPRILLILFSLVTRIFVKNPPYLDDRSNWFPQSAMLEENWLTIRQELQDLLKQNKAIPKVHELDPAQSNVSDDETPPAGLCFLLYGRWIEKNCALCPQTTALLKQCPNVNIAIFSIMDSHKKIPRHWGPDKGVLRYHLALMVPEDGPCYLINGGQRHDWKEGEGLLFDDTYYHEAHNESNGQRVVLFLDVMRELPGLLQPISRWLYWLQYHSPVIKKAVRRALVS